MTPALNRHPTGRGSVLSGYLVYKESVAFSFRTLPRPHPTPTPKGASASGFRGLARDPAGRGRFSSSGRSAPAFACSAWPFSDALSPVLASRFPGQLRGDCRLPEARGAPEPRSCEKLLAPEPQTARSSRLPEEERFINIRQTRLSQPESRHRQLESVTHPPV